MLGPSDSRQPAQLGGAEVRPNTVGLPSRRASARSDPVRPARSSTSASAPPACPFDAALAAASAVSRSFFSHDEKAVARAGRDTAARGSASRSASVRHPRRSVPDKARAVDDREACLENGNRLLVSPPERPPRPGRPRHRSRRSARRCSRVSASAPDSGAKSRQRGDSSRGSGDGCPTPARAARTGACRASAAPRPGAPSAVRRQPFGVDGPVVPVGFAEHPRPEAPCEGPARLPRSSSATCRKSSATSTSGRMNG